MFWGWVMRVMLAVPSLTLFPRRDAEQVMSRLSRKGRIFPSALGKPDPGSPACAGGSRDALLWDAVPGTLIPRRLIAGMLSQGC